MYTTATKTHTDPDVNVDFNAHWVTHTDHSVSLEKGMKDFCINSNKITAYEPNNKFSTKLQLHSCYYNIKREFKIIEENFSILK